MRARVSEHDLKTLGVLAGRVYGNVGCCAVPEGDCDERGEAGALVDAVRAVLDATRRDPRVPIAVIVSAAEGAWKPYPNLHAVNEPGGLVNHRNPAVRAAIARTWELFAAAVVELSD